MAKDVRMIRYCDIHGAVEVPDGPPNQIFKCDQGLGQVPCNTLLTIEPRVQRPMPQMGIHTVDAPQNTTPQSRAKLLHQGAFLAAYKRLGSITKAAETAEVDRTRHYEWLEDPEYEKQFMEAHKAAVQNLVDTAYNRAMGVGVEASDRLMIKFLESIPPGMSPKGWLFNAPRRMEHSGPGGGPIETNEVNARDALSSRITSLTTPADPPSGS